MINLITKFIDWVKDAFSLITGFPSMISSVIQAFNSFFSFLPSGIGTLIFGFVAVCVTFVIVYAIVKLVSSLL